MPTDRHTVKTYLNDAELTHLGTLANRLHLSRSDLLRRLVMAYAVPAATDFDGWQSIRDLLKVNADLARLGNLFKLTLDEAPDKELAAQLATIAANITATQTDLKACVRDIRARLQPTRP